jgi:hypothetical protein
MRHRPTINRYRPLQDQLLDQKLKLLSQMLTASPDQRVLISRRLGEIERKLRGR